MRDADGTDHRLWRIDDDDVLAAISRSLADLPLVIADGHHRYETAMTYRASAAPPTATHDGEQPYDFAPVSTSRTAATRASSRSRRTG